jgi:RNA polymerase sigma factor (sigma-70 family)
MALSSSDSVVRQIGSLYDGSSVAGLSDRQLLERFTAQPGAPAEAAFAALVLRHGPMVLGVCNELLGDRHHAEDAFQAAFLVLAQKARSIRDPDLLGNWLYGVALRTSRYVRARLARRRKNEDAGSMLNPNLSPRVTVPSAERLALAREQAELLHQEIERLPRAFRLTVVLCYLEGLTVHEAARRLRCSHGTVRSRMARARDKLGRALTRRGVLLPAAALAAALAPRTAWASISPNLCETTTRAAVQFAAGQCAAPSAAALARAVLRSMLVNNLRLTVLSLLLLAAGATGAGFLARAKAIGNEAMMLRAAQQPTGLDETKQKPAPGRMFVVGRVVDPGGKPAPGARVTTSARAKFSEIEFGMGRPPLAPIGNVDADGTGRFRVEAPRTSSSRNDGFVAVALAPGFGVGWVEIDPDADEPAGEITLQPEQEIEGRLFDVQGRPAAGVVVSVSSIEREVVHESGRPVENRLFEGPTYDWARVNDIPAWPKPATTGVDGRFTIRGVGRRRKAALSIIDPRFAPQRLDVETDDANGAKLVTQALQGAKLFAGRVTDAETGKSIPHAKLLFYSFGQVDQRFQLTRFQADGEGRFRASPALSQRFDIAVTPPSGQFYVEARKRVDWPKGAVEQQLDFALDRGAAIRGTVTEEGTTLPVRGASVTFVTLSQADVDRPGWRSTTVSGADGSFELAVVPRTGHLAVQAPDDHFCLRTIGLGEIAWNRPGGRRVYANAFVVCDPKLSGPGVEVHLTLRRGVTVAGRIVGPDDKPARDAWVIGRAVLDPRPAFLGRQWRGSYHALAPNGQFELHGLDPEIELPVYFLEPKQKLGALIRLSGRSAAAIPPSVRLEPCGAATARLVDPQGQPVAAYRHMALIRLVITPGPEGLSRDPEDMKRLSCEADSLFRIDPINYFKPPVSDAQGRVAFPVLIPGATYRISDHSAAKGNGDGVKLRKEFTVKPGETLDLGDILIEKPQAR